MMMLSVISLALILGLVAYMVKSRRAVLLAGFFLIFPLVYRAVDIVYLDLFGPLYAREVGRFVGGNGAAPVFIFAALAFIVPLLLIFPDRGRALARLAQHPPAYLPYHRYVTNAALLGSMLILAALLANFIRVGTIPIIQGIDRLEYSISAGILHNGFYELNFLINFVLGAFTVLPRINGRDYDSRFALIMVALICYWVVTGNRFSIFFTVFSFYFMPFAAVVLAEKVGRTSPNALRSLVQRLLTSRTAQAVGGIATVLLLSGLVLNSYFNVRSYREPLYEIQERILIQPVQLWASAWDRVDFDNISNPINEFAIDQIIFNPIDADRSSTIQYLMTLELGYFRSAELTELGQAYNGGYPEVHFEILGAWLPFLSLPLAGFIGAFLLVMCIRLLMRNMIASAIMGIYLFYGTSLHFAGGMITFMLYPSYWAKILLFVMAYMIEQQIMSRGRATVGAPPAAQSFPPPRRDRGIQSGSRPQV